RMTGVVANFTRNARRCPVAGGDCTSGIASSGDYRPARRVLRSFSLSAHSRDSQCREEIDILEPFDRGPAENHQECADRKVRAVGQLASKLSTEERDDEGK